MPQIQNAFKAGPGYVTQKGWNVQAERPEYITEDYRNEKIRSNSRSEFSRNRLQDEFTDQAYDTCAPQKKNSKKFQFHPKFLVSPHFKSRRKN